MRGTVAVERDDSLVFENDLVVSELRAALILSKTRAMSAVVLRPWNQGHVPAAQSPPHGEHLRFRARLASLKEKTSPP